MSVGIYRLLLLHLCVFIFISCSKKKEDDVLTAPDVEVPPLSTFPLQVGANVAFNYSSFILTASTAELCRSSAIDSEGNIYCAGEVSGSFADETGGGDSDAFIMKVNPAGLIQWITQVGATAENDGLVNDASSTDKCLDLVVDSQDNVYCGGTTWSNLQVPLVGSGEDAFMIKLNSEGEIQWVRHFTENLSEITSSSGVDKCLSVAVDSNDNVFCGGQTRSNFAETHSGWGDIFIAKLTSAGDITWVKQIGNATKIAQSLDTTEEEACLSLATDSAGNVYCGGYTYGSLADTNSDLSNSTDLILMKLNAAGDFQWLKQEGSSSSFDTSSGEECKSLATDASGNVFCAGSTYGSMMEVNLDVGNSADLFLIKFNSNGIVQWGVQLGDTTKDSIDIGHSIDPSNLENVFSVALDSQGNVFVGGDTYSNLGEPNGGENDIFIAKFNSQGQLSTIKQIGATTQENSTKITDTSKNDYCYGLSVDTDDNVFCAGYTTGELSDTKAESGYSDADVFILKLDIEGNI